MSEKKVSGKVLMFTGIVIIVFLVAIFGLFFWEPVPEMIQVRRRPRKYGFREGTGGTAFLVDEGDQVMKGDTVAIG